MLLFLAVPASAWTQSIYGINDVEAFREGRDKEFRNQAKSPLLNTDFSKFKGLSYFENDESYRLEAIYKSTPDESYFMMPTTSGKSVKYRKVGELTFEWDDKRHVLGAYQSEKTFVDEDWNTRFGRTLFIPFRDLTNGRSTYGGGRYISMIIPESSDAVLDFNLAYNPSCAYGSAEYSCPIPPRSNKLRVLIEAGEKTFAYTKSSRT